MILSVQSKCSTLADACINTLTHKRTYTHTHTHTHTHACMHEHTYMRVHTRIHTHTRIHECMYMCARAHTHTHTFSHTQKHALIHSCKERERNKERERLGGKTATTQDTRSLVTSEYLFLTAEILLDTVSQFRFHQKYVWSSVCLQEGMKKVDAGLQCLHI